MLGGFFVDSGFVEPNRLTVTRHLVRSPGARPGAPRVRIVQLTDLHLHSLGRLHEQIARVVADVQPHLIAISGDSVDREESLALLGDFLSMLPRGVPVLATWGNWEHYTDIDLRIIADVYARHGARVLNNESTLLTLADAPLLVTGLDSSQDGRPDMELAVRGAPLVANHLLLAHCPVQRDQVIDWAHRDAPLSLHGAPAERRTLPSLVLSGHTHGGQITLGGWAPITPTGSGRYVAGWYADAPVPLYVSRGIGMTAVPVRFMCPPEVAVFEWEMG